MHVAPSSFPICPDIFSRGVQVIAYNLITEQLGTFEVHIAAPVGTDIPGTFVHETVPPTGIPRPDQDISHEHKQKVLEIVEEIRPNLIHNHCDSVLPGLIELGYPFIHTLHHTAEEFLRTLENYGIDSLSPNQIPVAISSSQQGLYHNKGVDISNVVYNGIDTSRYPLNEKPMNYVLCLGCILPEKGPQIAIDAFPHIRELGLDLIITGSMGNTSEVREFFEREILPNIDIRLDESLGERRNAFDAYRQFERHDPLIFFAANIREEEKRQFVSNAKVGVLAVNGRPEPFGLVPLELMCSGVPVVTTNFGAFPEIILDTTTGILVPAGSDYNVYGGAVADALNLSRKACADHVRQKFSRERMNSGYMELYKDVYLR